MIETRNEELAEEREKKLRSSNLILYGVSEASSNDKSEAKKNPFQESVKKTRLNRDPLKLS